MKLRQKNLGIIGAIWYVSKTIINKNNIKLNLNNSIKIIDNYDEDYLIIQEKNSILNLDKNDKIYALNDTRIKNIDSFKNSLKDYRKKNRYDSCLTIKKLGDKFYRNISVNINLYKKEISNKSLILDKKFSSIYNSRSESFADLVEKLMPSVVNIIAYSNFSDVGYGSGFITTYQGIVVTNNHVIQGKKYIKVTYDNGPEYKAKLLGADPVSDIAVLKLEIDKKFTPVNFGNSDKARIGEWVIAIGNPLTLGRTVTSGIISAKKRKTHIERYVNNIQTDASINTGNSGGPYLI